MSIDYITGDGHISPKDVHVFVQTTIPGSGDKVAVGDLWSDTTAALLKRCTSTSPITFASTEGGSSAHTLDSATHSDVAAATEAKGMVLAWDSVAGAWTALAVGTNGQQLEADSTLDIGVKWAAAGGSHVFTADTELTIATGDIAATQDYHRIDTEADAASDNLDGITGGSDGDILLIRPENTARTVVVRHNQNAANVKNILLQGGNNYTMDDDSDMLLLVYEGGIDTNGAWIEIARSVRAHGELTGIGTDDHHAQSHDYDTHAGGVPFADVEYDDATSDPLPADETAAADGIEGSAARKDHRHLGHASSHTLASHSARAHADLSDAPTTAHQAEVSLAGTPDYITISGQVITRGLVVLTTDVSGTLPVTEGGTNLTALPDVEIPISAASMKGSVTAGAGDTDRLPESRELATNDVNIDYMAFDNATEENAQFQFSIPSGWDEGTITFRYKWTNAAGLTTETLVMGLKAVAISNDGALDQAWGTEITITDTWLAQDDVHISAESAALTIGGTPAEGDLVVFNLARKTGSDNLTGDGQILELIITFTRASYSD